MRVLLCTLAFFLGACSASTPTPATGQVMLDPSYTTVAPILIQWGQHWEHPSQTVRARNGVFALPARARFASAFVDSDGDGTLDRFYEPSARCTRAASEWRCAIPRSSVFVHRYLREAPDESVDKVIAGGDAFLSNGAVDWDPTLCAEGGACARPNAGPFDAGLGRMLALCELDDVDSHEATLSFAGATYTARRPDPVRATFRQARQPGGAVAVEAHFDRPVDRAIVWVGTVGAAGELRARLWDSEHATAGMLTPTSFTATIPAQAAAACDEASCLVTVQLAREVPGELSTLSVFEGSATL